MKYDDIIIGAGSAGAVVAARLSEDPDRKVLLLEAGADYPELASMPAELLDGSAPVMAGHNWSIDAFSREEAQVPFRGGGGGGATATATAAMRPVREHNGANHFDYSLGKVAGGSSATNGAIAFPGVPEDYEEWAEAGNTDWAWPKVEAAFQRLVSDPLHPSGRDSREPPIPLHRVLPRDFTRVQKGFYQACLGLGFPHAEDLFQPGTAGVGGIPKNTRDGIRVSTALAYLSQGRKRPNLTILSRAQAASILVSQGRAQGVDAFVGGEPRRFHGARVTVCAGAVMTPALLMRSGLGPAAELGRLAIDIHADLPGVGRNLRDHSSVAIWFDPKPGVYSAGEPFHQAMLRYTAEQSPDRNDMQVFMLGGVKTEAFPMLRAALGTSLAMAVSVVLAKPRSQGRIELVSADPSRPPVVRLNCAGDPLDLQRLMEGARVAWRISQQEALRSQMGRIFMWNARIMESDALLKGMVNSMVRGAWHAVGTAKMGPEKDPMSVVDQFGALRGCRGIRVADASIMPTIPRAPTNLTCMMIGEKVAEHMRGTED